MLFTEFYDNEVNNLASTTSNPANQMVRNPHLKGLQCLRCDAAYPLALAHDGCPVCARQGAHVSLRASYNKQSDALHYLPYVDVGLLGEGRTPLIEAPAVARAFGLANLHIKDESKNPTGSHKDRMSAIGAQQAIDFGAHTVVLASSGNAAVSAAYYANAFGLACEVATYAGMAKAYADALDAAGAKCFAFDDNAGRWQFVAQRSAQPGYFALTNYHLPALGSAPLAIEGYKAIAYECQAQGCVPEHILVPTARGDLAWGIYAGFRDLLDAGQINALPKIWVVEPFARLSKVLAGYSLHENYPGQTAQFSTAGATVTYLQWQAATASGGGALVVPDSEALAARRVLTQHGISTELCAAAGFAAIAQLHALQAINAHSKLLLILTANASRDPSFTDNV